MDLKNWIEWKKEQEAKYRGDSMQAMDSKIEGKPIKSWWVSTAPWRGMDLSVWPDGGVTIEARQKDRESGKWSTCGKLNIHLNDLASLVAYVPLAIESRDQYHTKSA